MLELAKNIVNKSLIISKIFLKEVFELLLRYLVLGLGATFLLILLLNYCFTKKQDSKKDSIWSIGPSKFEIIFTVLVKTIIIQV